MKIFLLIGIFFLTSLLQAFSQTSGSIKGLVKDGDKPVEFCNIILSPMSDSNVVTAFATTDATGTFLLEKIAIGKYQLRVHRVGYLHAVVAINISNEQSSTNVGVIQLKADTKALQNVTVTARKKLIQRTPQGFVIKAEDNLTQAAGTVTDLLANTPTVLVDAEGGISIRGKSPTILINGRNSVLGAASLDRIPASSIDRIEIINNPSAKYDAAGEGGIINIILKKSNGEGTNGAFALGGGYGAKGRFNSSIQLNHEVNDWNFGMAYDNRIAGRTREANAERVTFNSIDQYYLNQYRFDDRNERTHNLRFNTEFAPGKRDEFALEAIYGYDYQFNNEALTSTFTTQDNKFTSSNLRVSDEEQKENALELAFNYTRKFADKRKSLTAEITADASQEIQNTDITTQSLDAAGKPVGDPYLQQSYNDEKANISNVKFDYVQPLSARAILETGYKGIFRWLNSDAKNSYQDNGVFVPDPKQSSLFEFNEQVHGVYGIYKSYTGDKEEPRWKYEAGIRLEQTINNGNNAGNTNSFENSYFNAFPNANLAYYLGRQEFVKLSYSKRINRPGLGSLNPFTDITDSLNQRSGNPNLQPELVNVIETGYSKDWNHFTIGANFFYRQGTNTILPYTVLDSNGVAFTKPENFGSSTTYGMEGIITADAGPVWNATASISLYQQNIEGKKEDIDLSNSAFSWYVKMVNTFSFWKGSRIQIAANYQAPTATPQGTRLAVYNVDFGYQQKIMRGRGRLGLTIPDIFNIQQSGLTFDQPDFTFTRTFKVDTRAVLLTFAYTFGTAFKEKLMENKYSND